MFPKDHDIRLTERESHLIYQTVLFIYYNSSKSMLLVSYFESDKLKHKENHVSDINTK